MADGGRLRVLGIAGTRPEAIKMAPVAIEAARRPAIDYRCLATGQHGALFDEALAAFGLAADLRLPAVATGADPDVAIAALAAALALVIAVEAPDLVLVQGDTNSAYAGAIAAARLGIAIGHVEAGLRSGDPLRPWPEERNRIGIDALASLLFAPTDAAAANLAADPAVTGVAAVTGNTGIDALVEMRRRLPDPPAGGPRRLLLTCHRRESIGAGIAAICTAAREIAARGDVEMLCPVHPNPAVGATVRAMLADVAAIRLVAPLSYRETVAALAGATLVLTDSGGLQEEAATLGIPTLVLREETERPEGIASGNLRLVGTDPASIVAHANRLLDDPAAHAAMTRRSMPFGNGDAAAKIFDVVEHHFSRSPARDQFLPLPGGATKDGALTGTALGA